MRYWVVLAAFLAPAAVAQAPQMLDPRKPVFLAARGVLCISADELEAFRSGAPARCQVMDRDEPAVIRESAGVVDVVYRVRLTGRGNQVVEGWAPRASLKN